MFPHGDPEWRETLAFLERHRRAGEAILAPTEFIEPIAEAYGYRAAYALDPERFTFVVIHKGQLDELVPAQMGSFRRRLAPVFANPVFVVLGPPERGEPCRPAYCAVLDKIPTAPARASDAGRTVAFVATHDRPDALARSLPQIAGLGVEVLVVDDGSVARVGERVAALCREHGARRIRLDENRGLPTAQNVGLAYWLADPEVAWISSFQDDVDVHPELLSRLARVADPCERPILSGRVASEHPSLGRTRIDGIDVVRLRSAPGVHLHAHRDYWRAVLPIPTPYVGAPKPEGGHRGQGADEDFWVTCWAPHSIAKRGGFVTCVPDLVRTFATQPRASTWAAGGRAADPPLAPRA